MALWQILILAVVQGVAEFLPISSSGHLVILEALLGARGDLMEVNIALHAGTLASILVFYWQRVWRLLSEDRRVVMLLLVGSLPAGVVGIAIESTAKETLECSLLAGCMLLVTGGVLLLTAWLTSGGGAVGHVTYQEMTFGKSFLIGLSQAVAILPGVSRSGSTICAALSLGLSPQSAATFSFLLAIPAIAGATLLEMIHSIGPQATSTTPPLYLALGASVSFVVGLFALQWLIRLLERGSLRIFAWWCIPVGLGVIVWRLTTQGWLPLG